MWEISALQNNTFHILDEAIEGKKPFIKKEYYITWIKNTYTQEWPLWSHIVFQLSMVAKFRRFIYVT